MVESLKTQLISRLCDKMYIHGWNQKDLANKCACSKSYISGVLKGKSTLDKLIDIMGKVGLEVVLEAEDLDGNKS